MQMLKNIIILQITVDDQTVKQSFRIMDYVDCDRQYRRVELH